MMKRRLLSCAFLLAPVLFIAAQQAQSITNVVTDAASAYLTPLGGGTQSGDSILVAHFKAPTQALGDWAVDRFTDAFKEKNVKVIERRNRPAFLADTAKKFDTELSDADAAALGARTSVLTVITGTFTPRGNNWALAIRAIRVSNRRNVWSKNYVIQPGATFTELATPAPAAAPAASAPAPAPAASAPAPAAAAPAPAAPARQPAPAAASAPVQASATGPLAKGVYSFTAKPRATKAGVGVNTYLAKVEVLDDYTLIYLTNKSAAGDSYIDGFFYNSNRRNFIAQDLDNPGNDVAPVSVRVSEDNVYRILSFENFQLRHFRLIDNGDNPNIMFRELTLTVPGEQR
jgi:TolB-like protein